MSTNNWQDDDDNEFEEQSPSDLLKDLRRQLKEQAKALKALTDENQGLKASTRERSVKDVLSEKGINPKVAQFIPADIDTPDAVSKWLEDNGDVFGFTPAPADAGQQPSMRIPEGDAAALRTMSAVQSGVQAPGSQEDILRRLQDPTLSREELNRLTGLNWDPSR